MNSASDTLISVLTGLATQIPMFIVYIAGAVVGVTRYKRHPKVSQLVVASCLFLAVLQFGVTLVYSTTALWMGSIPYSATRWIFTGLSASDSFAGALGHGVLIAAAFIDRASAASE